jgi:hypothetical protein
VDVEGKSGKEILESLTGEQAKSLIAALTATPVDVAVDDEGGGVGAVHSDAIDDDEDGDNPALVIA